MKGNTNIFTSSGRIPRSTHWIFLLGIWAALVVIVLLTGGFERPAEGVEKNETAQVIGGLLMIPFFLVALMMQIKRWHDRGKSGWWVFINLLPCIGGIWALIELGFLPGTPGPNEYGPDPLQ